MTSSRPKVFLGSSKESLPVLNILSDGLAGVADVVRWTDSDDFQHPGEYFLDSLVAAASVFDVAVLVFGKDDIVISRSKRHPTPRDNVIFELGLFMNSLGRHRTLVVAPRVWRTKLRILSDLAGLKLAEFDPPKSPKDLPLALRDVIRFLRKTIRDSDVRPHVRGPAHVGFLWPEIEKFLANRSLAPHKVDNLALDMEVTWRYVYDQILSASERSNIRCRILFIDHKSRSISAMSSATVSVRTARNREAEIVRSCNQLESDLRRRKIHFECRAYADIPVVHGFVLNDDRLFLSMCSVRAGRLMGSPNPYFYAELPTTATSDIAAAHLFDVFGGWFAHYWKTARPVWPVKESS